MRKLYETSHLLSAQDRELFIHPIEDMMKQPITSLRTWIQTAWPTVRTCLQRHTERIIQQNHRIINFFQADGSTPEEVNETYIATQVIQEDNSSTRQITSQSDISHHESITQVNERILIYDTHHTDTENQHKQNGE